MTLRNLQNEAQKVRMTPEEKATLLRALMTRFEGHVHATPSPYIGMFTLRSFSVAGRAVAAVLVFLVVGGSGVAYAAEGSLPGQPLYPVKVNVVEPVQVALAPTTAAKAAVYVHLAQTRVEEAETLASQGDLDATNTQTLAQNFDSQVNNADALSLQVANTDPAAAADIQTGLSASLEAHSSILSQIGSRDGATTKKESDDFAAQVLASAHRIGGEGFAGAGTTTAVVALTTAPKVRTFAAIAPNPNPAAATSSVSGSVSVTVVSATSSSEESATTTGEGSATSTENNQGGNAEQTSESGMRATQALMQAQSAYDTAKSSLDTTTAAQLDAQFAQAGSLLQNGDYTAALRLAVKLQTLIETQQKLHTNILPLLQLNLNFGTDRRGGDSGGDNSDR